MPCTTLLAGKRATYDGSTFMARNEDASAGQFTPKKFIVVQPQDQPRRYVTVHGGLEIQLPETPLRYTAMPNALPEEGIWGEAGVNACNVAMTETETITSNPRVLGADPLVENGIGEEDFLTLVLPYIRSAREGVLRLGALLETYGTYEMNGVGFQDRDEVWWLETIGGHHWMARRVPDDSVVVMPNQQGIDRLDLVDAFGARRETLCSEDLIAFIRENHLDLRMDGGLLEEEQNFDARAAFGSRDDADHVYNTPRAWFMLRYLSPRLCRWDGAEPDFGPEADDLPWSLVPAKKITVEDVKYLLSSHYQGTPYDPYLSGTDSGRYRSIGINRNNFLALTQLRPYAPEDHMAVEWVAMGSNVFNAFVPFYANVDRTPAYLAGTASQVTTEQFYWANRLLGALADAHYAKCASHIERYQNAVAARGRAMLRDFDRQLSGDNPLALEDCNDRLAAMVRAETDKTLDKVLYEASCGMRNSFSRSDA